MRVLNRYSYSTHCEQNERGLPMMAEGRSQHIQIYDAFGGGGGGGRRGSLIMCHTSSDGGIG